MTCQFEAIDEKYYDEAIREAIEQAKEDGYWNEIKSMSPEDHPRSFECNLYWKLRLYMM